MNQSGTISNKNYTLEYSAISDTGLVRAHNEDLYLVLEEEQIFCVADGAGGHGKGDLASHLTIKGISEVVRGTDNKPFDDTIPIGEDTIAVPGLTNNSHENETSEDGTILIPAIHHANELCRNSGVPNIASTIVSYHFNYDTIHVAHVGDSRAYRFRDNTLQQITKDHSLVNYLCDKGEITEEEKLTHPKKNVILRAIGAEEQVTIEHQPVTIDKEAVYLLCSDGLTGMVSDQVICSYMQEISDLNQLSTSLIQAAKNNGGRDNITIILIKVKNV